jgi:predicted phosphodiesterase
LLPWRAPASWPSCSRSRCKRFGPPRFRAPTYTGSLKQAPWFIALVNNAATNTEALGARLRNVAANLQVLYGRIQGTAGLPGGDGDGSQTIKVLHISDIHNNPLAVNFVRDLARNLAVDLVIDTGDLTDFGTPLENRLSAGLTRLGVPYVFVAGNHDSRATVRALATAGPNVTVLTTDAPLATVGGLRILGAPDPSAARPAAGDVNTPPEALRQAGETLLARYQQESASGAPPDLVCVHNPRQAEPLVGVAPVVLCGHMHHASVTTERNTVICNAGTTGAAGARYFEKPEGVPFSAAVLHFARPSGGGESTAAPSPGARSPALLLYIDQIVLDGALNQYSITRRTFAAPAAETQPAPGVDETAARDRERTGQALSPSFLLPGAGRSSGSL